MKWRGEFTCDGQLIVECEDCSGSGMQPVTGPLGEYIDRDHCSACGGTADDYWDPAALLQSLFAAAALAHAFDLGSDHPRLWKPNTAGTAAPAIAPIANGRAA